MVRVAPDRAPGAGLGFVIMGDSADGLLALHHRDDVRSAGHHVHLGFRVASIQDIHAFHARVLECGRDVVAYETAGAFGYCRISDPDGHHVEVYAT